MICENAASLVVVGRGCCGWRNEVKEGDESGDNVLNKAGGGGDAVFVFVEVRMRWCPLADCSPLLISYVHFTVFTLSLSAAIYYCYVCMFIGHAATSSSFNPLTYNSTVYLIGHTTCFEFLFNPNQSNVLIKLNCFIIHDAT